MCALTVVAAISANMAGANAARCGSGEHGGAGYAYAGHQAATVSHGIRATVTPIVEPNVLAGHVAGWIGVGGPGEGPNGVSEWLQVGVSSMPGRPVTVYTELVVPGREPVYTPLIEGVRVGEHHSLALLEVQGLPGWWRVWVDGRPVTKSIHLPGSNGRWQPIVTAESFNDNKGVCNSFGFRFERVGVARTLGGSWRPFVPGYDFLDRGNAIRPLRADAASTVRTLAAEPVTPYAFEAVSV